MINTGPCLVPNAAHYYGAPARHVMDESFTARLVRVPHLFSLARPRCVQTRNPDPAVVDLPQGTSAALAFSARKPVEAKRRLLSDRCASNSKSAPSAKVRDNVITNQNRQAKARQNTSFHCGKRTKSATLNLPCQIEQF